MNHLQIIAARATMPYELLCIQEETLPKQIRWENGGILLNKPRLQASQ
ncbi:MAG: hypothetical protein AAF990_27255 [Bacteroidota bacterium]